MQRLPNGKHATERILFFLLNKSKGNNDIKNKKKKSSYNNLQNKSIEN